MIGASSAREPVTPFPSMSGRPPAEDMRSVRTFWLYRSWVEAPTEMIHGASAGDPVVASSGPEFPFEVATKIPAARAFKNPTVSKSLHRAEGASDPIE